MKLSFPKPRSIPATGTFGLDAILAIGESERDHRVGRSGDDSALLALVDGQRTVAEILRVSRIPGSVALRRLRALSERRIIRAIPARAATLTGGRAPAQRAGMTQDLSAVADAFVQMGVPILRPHPATGRPAAVVMVDEEALEFSRTPVTPPPVVVSAPPAPAARPRAAARTSATAIAVRAPAASEPRDTPERALVPDTPADGDRRSSTGQRRASVEGLPRSLIPVSALATQVQELWFKLTKRDWTTLVMIPAHAGGSAYAVASALAEIGSAYGDQPVQLLSAEGRKLWPVEDWILPRRPRGSAGPHPRRVIALDALNVNPGGATLAQAADAAVMVVETGVARLATVRRVIEGIGRTRFVGCVMVSSD